MRYRGENLVENSVNEGCRGWDLEDIAEDSLKAALVRSQTVPSIHGVANQTCPKYQRSLANGYPVFVTSGEQSCGHHTWSSARSAFRRQHPGRGGGGRHAATRHVMERRTLLHGGLRPQRVVSHALREMLPKHLRERQRGKKY
jgi:hypothetical protein